MKKGVIVDIKNRQKVVLADNGRFYVSSLKKGEAVGSRVRVGICRKHIAAMGVCAAFCVTAFFAGMMTMRAMRAQVPDMLIQLRAVSDNESHAAIELITNADGKLLSAAPVDAAGEMVMAGESFEGMELEAAAVRYLEIVSECGFLDVEQGGFIAVSSYSQNAVRAEDGWKRTLLSIRDYAYLKRYKIAAFRTRVIYPEEMPKSICAENFWFPLYIAAKIQRSENAESDIAASIGQLKDRPSHAIMGIIEDAHKKYKQESGGEKKNRLLSEKLSLKGQYKEVLERIKNASTEGYVWQSPQLPPFLQTGIAVQMPVYMAARIVSAEG